MLAKNLQQVGEVLVAIKHLALAILDIVLQVEGYRLGGAKVFHILTHALAQLFNHAEEVIYRILAVENNSRIFTDMYTCFTEFAGGYAYHLEKFVKSDVDT